MYLCYGYNLPDVQYQQSYTASRQEEHILEMFWSVDGGPKYTLLIFHHLCLLLLDDQVVGLGVLSIVLRNGKGVGGE